MKFSFGKYMQDFKDYLFSFLEDGCITIISPYYIMPTPLFIMWYAQTKYSLVIIY